MSEESLRIRVVQFTRRFERAYKRKTEDQKQAVAEAITRLKVNPSHPSLRVKKVRGAGQQDIWEASTNMKHRITFEYSSSDGVIFRNCNGHEVFNNP